MKLLIDLGNTRLKACIHDDSLRLIEEIVDAPSLTTWLHHSGGLVTAAVISTVATIESYQRIKLVLKNYLPPAQIFLLQYNAELLETCYEFPDRLGVDRWLALLPFVRRGEAVVIDAGTAFTVDVLHKGVHQGGYILPGLRLQRDILEQQTAAVSFSHTQLGEIGLGQATAECVSHGSLRALVALANDVSREFHRGNERSALYITGGDAPYFDGHLDAERRPLLVFEGMLIALDHLVEKNK